MTQDDSQGTKNDQGKLRYDLMPLLAEEEIIKVFTKGAEKYADRNWEKGLKFGRNYAAARRHLQSFFKGEERDSEMQTSHLANAAVNIIMMLQFHLEGRHDELNDMGAKNDNQAS